MGLSNNQKQIADQFLDLLKKEGLQWTRLWRQPVPPQNGITGHIYQGMNYLTCAMRMFKYGWTDPRFITLKNVIALGGSIKGHKATPIVYYGPMKYEDKNGDERTRLGGRAYNAWNVEQLGLESHQDLNQLPVPFPTSAVAKNARIEHFIKQAGIVRKKDSRAYFNQKDDFIGIPDPSDFYSTDDRSRSENYYSVLLHEIVHWTGAQKRLNRIELKEYHVDKIQRAREELIAEIGSVFFGNKFEIQTHPSNENAAYVQSWIKLLEANQETIYGAAQQANKALQYCSHYDSLDEAYAA